MRKDERFAIEQESSNHYITYQWSQSTRDRAKVRADRKTIRKYARIAESSDLAGGSISKSPGVATGLSSLCVVRRGRPYTGPCPLSL